MVRSKIILTIVTLTDFLGTVMVNGFATAAPVNKKTKGELVEKYPTDFVPRCSMKPCHSQVSKWKMLKNCRTW